MSVTAKEANELLARLKEVQPLLEKVAEAPSEPPASLPGASKTASRDNYGEVVELRHRFLKESPANLNRMIQLQLVQGANEGMGVPLTRWGNQSTLAAFNFMNDGAVTKLLETAGGTPMIRQDLEPMLYAAYVKKFPWYDRIKRKPANGLVHAFNRKDELPTASFISDTGTVPDSQGRYTRGTTNIAIAAVRVGTNLKLQFAVQAGGMGYNPEAEEISGGITALAKKVQQALFSGNASVPGKIATDPEGLYDANGFDGLRIQVPSGNIQAVGTGLMLPNLNILDGVLGSRGSTGSIILMDGQDRVTLMNELQPNMRFVNKVNVVPGLPDVEAVNLGNSGEVPVLSIPGAEMGTYTVGSDTVRDAYLLNEDVIAMPYLGSESPTVLDIPMGVNGQLTHLFILFMMVGLEVSVPNFIGKIRITQ